MNYPTVKRCIDCRWSVKRNDRWDMACQHPLVNAADPYFLSYDHAKLGSDCTDQRRQTGLFAKCGMRGKLFEFREDQ